MATLRERLEYVINLDAKQALKSLDEMGKSAEKNLGKAESKIDKLGGNFTKFGAMAVGAAGVAGVGLYKLSQVASNTAESINAVTVTFGEASKGVLQLSQDAAQSVGMAQADFNQLSVSLAGFAKQMGTDVVQTVDDMTTRIADFASVMNLDVNEAAITFRSALAGETEAMRRYGIDVSAAAVETFALANGIAESASSMTEAEKVQARYGLIMRETSQWAGDFANTADSAANQQRILAAELQNAASELGAGLLPMLTTAVSALGDVVGAFGSLPGPVKSATGSVLGWGTAALGAAGAVSFIAGQVIKFRDNLGGLPSKLRNAEGGLNGMGKAAKGAGIALGALAVTDIVFGVLNDTGDASGNLERKLQALNIALGDIESGASSGEAAMAAFRDAVAAEGKGLKLSNLWEDFGKEIRIVGGEIGRNIEEIDRAFQSILDSSPQQAQALLDVWVQQNAALDQSSQQYKDNAMLIERYQERVDLLVDSTNALEASTGASTGATEENTTAVEKSSTAVADAAEAAEELAQQLEDLYNATMDNVQATLDYEGKVIALNQSYDDYIEKLREAQEDGEVTREELLDLSGTMVDLKGDIIATAEAFAEHSGAAAGSRENITLQIEELERLKEVFPELAVFIDGHIAKLNSIPRFVKTDMSVTGIIDGGVYDSIRRADGGITIANADGNFLPDQATVRRGGTLYQWAEPETGGEAFIPLGVAKRRRSVQLWRQVGEFFGLVRKAADGDVVATQVASTGAMSSPGLRPVMPDEATEAFEELAKAAEAAGMEIDDYFRSLEEAWEGQAEIYANMYEAGKVTTADFKAWLKEQQAALVPYSDEWVALGEQIRSVTEDAKQAAQDRTRALFEEAEAAKEVTVAREDLKDSYASALEVLRDDKATEEQKDAAGASYAASIVAWLSSKAAARGIKPYTVRWAKFMRAKIERQISKQSKHPEIVKWLKIELSGIPVFDDEADSGGDDGSAVDDVAPTPGAPAERGDAITIGAGSAATSTMTLARSGPAVVIENYHAHTEVDNMALINTLEFATKRGTL